MKILILLLAYSLIFLSTLRASPPKYELVVCTIFRDDAKYLPEWIEFHHKQGVEHFYLYNNLSSDHPEKVLKNYIKKEIVTLIHWPYEHYAQEDWNRIQCAAYQHCTFKNKNCRWIAFLDTDEFLFCPDKTDLRVFLKDYAEYGSISAYWRMYGTSNTIIAPYQKLLDCLVHRARDDYPAHKTMKTIAQRKYIEDIVNPHYVIHHPGRSNFICDISKLRINHYWSRDMDFFYRIKLPRREKWYGERMQQMLWEREMNEVYDPILASPSR